MRKLSTLLLLLCMGCTTVPALIDTDIPNPPKKEDTILSFVAVGDNLIHGAVYYDAFTNGIYDFTAMYQEIKPYLKDTDVAFVNQETILGGKALGLSHYPQFNSPEEVASALVDAGFNLVNHATNHALDKREQGIRNALETWDQYPGVVVGGINRSQEEQDTIRVIEKKGIKLSFLAYTEQTNGISMPSNRPYLVNMIDKDRIRDDVAKAKELSDIILVSMHWGSEDTYSINAFQKEYALYLHQLGVDVIIGTHPHSIQPVELLGKETGHQTLVMYSLGNFLSAQDAEINMLEGMMHWNISIDSQTKKKKFTTLVYTPLINHFESGFKRFRVYALKDYTAELEKKHGLQGYKKQSISKQRFETIVKGVITGEIDIDL